MNPADNIAGRVALISGGATGIGRAMALGLLARGCRVAVVDLKDDALARFEQDARHASATAEVLAVQGDVTRLEDCERAVSTVVQRFGALDGLVNNAGLGMRAIKEDNLESPVRFWEVDPGRWQLVVDVNFKGSFFMARSAAPHMVAQKRGRIVNVTTSLDTMLRAAYTPYGQSKAALEAATVSWARDLDGTGVTVNVLIPGGAVNTNFFSPEAQLNRDELLQPDVMVAPLCWLMSDASAAVTAQRFVARRWDGTLPAAEAARQAGRAAAWQDMGAESAWPGGKPVR